MASSNVAAWFWHDGYAWDWLVTTAAIIVNHLVPVMAIDIRSRYYSPMDQSLGYPLVSNTISSWVLYILTFAFPGLVFVISACHQRSFADGHHALLSLAEAFALACGWKRWMSLVGRLRPNWLSVVGTDREEDARQAYPSGHSTYMFFSATVLTCWILGKLRVLSKPSNGLFAKLLLALAPLWLATFVAVTRLADYKHDFSDVNAGCFIGICTGLLGYLLNYPSLLDAHCHLPKLRSRVSPLSSQLVNAPAASQADAERKPAVKGWSTHS